MREGKQVGVSGFFFFFFFFSGEGRTVMKPKHS